MHQHNDKDLLDQIKNLTLQYNSRVTPRRRVQVQKPTDAFQMLMENRDANMNTSSCKSLPHYLNLTFIVPVNANSKPAEAPNQAKDQENKENKQNTESKRPKSYRKYTSRYSTWRLYISVTAS